MQSNSMGRMMAMTITATVAIVTSLSCSSLETRTGETVKVYIKVNSGATRSMSSYIAKQHDDVADSLASFTRKFIQKSDIDATIIDSADKFKKGTAHYYLNIQVANYHVRKTGHRGPYGIPIVIRNMTITYRMVNARGQVAVQGSKYDQTPGPASRGTGRVSRVISDKVTGYLHRKYGS